MRIGRLSLVSLGGAVGIFVVSTAALAHTGGHGPVPKDLPLSKGRVAFLYSAGVIQASESGPPLTERNASGVVELVELGEGRFELHPHKNSAVAGTRDSDLKVIALDEGGKMQAVLSTEAVRGNPWRFGIKTHPSPKMIEVILTDRAKPHSKWVAAFQLP